MLRAVLFPSMAATVLTGRSVSGHQLDAPNLVFIMADGKPVCSLHVLACVRARVFPLSAAEV
jgi:hypothetical protein